MILQGIAQKMEDCTSVASGEFTYLYLCCYTIFFSEETKYFATSADFAVLYLSVLTRKGNHITGIL